MKRNVTAIFCFIAMSILILDTKTALQGAAEGISLCVNTVIPSLYPFIILSMILTSALLGTKMPLLRPIGKLLRMPDGAESIWLAGSLGGYPVGAQSIGQAVNSGILTQSDGRRMLCFCANAGPSFIFGMGLGILGDIRLCGLIWFIHLISSLIVGILTPGKADSSIKLQGLPVMTLPQALPKATATMGMICGWVTLFRIILRMLQRWVFTCIPDTIQILIFGLLELSNGCVALPGAESIAHRFVLFSVFLGFGGLCVAMQTFSVVGNAEIVRWYLPAKIAQAACGTILSFGVAKLLFPIETVIRPVCLIICGIYLLAYHFILGKKEKIGLAFVPAVMYNRGKLHTR